MSEIKTRYSKIYSDNFGDIFRKPTPPKKELLCTHANETREFCAKHQRGCGLHAYHEPDGRCECLPCEPKQSSRVRYAGVCECEFIEHCSKCDPEYFGAEPPF